MQDAHPSTAHPALGLASLAACAAAAAAILLGVPSLFGLLMQAPAIAGSGPAALGAAFTLVTFGLLALVALAAIRLRGLPVPLGPRASLAAGGGLALGLVGFTVSVALCALAGTAQLGMPASQGAGLLLLETVLLVIQSGAEEYYFRAWLQADLERRWGTWPALAAASLLFAALHFVAAASEPLTFVTMLLGGLLFGLAYRKSGSLLFPWAIHFGWNWAEELAFGLVPNPGTGPFGALLNIDMRGSPWWGGTEEGLNASLSSVFVLVALLGAVLAWPSAADRPAPRLRKIPAPG
ncbi:CPBP family glutamic-type intramembrane protease [Novosphingobium soli]|uniref:Type II CAAX prenyl endopeptidase Rce1 family protein n=1 Tax=Novosphingobium soli TaxID=574956 RepID=A0ABV6D206_9SPHN